MSKVRVLVGTRKGAFILTSDGKRENWDVSGPHFAGWEMYHLKGSPADPNRIYASQSSGWFGQLIQRSDDGGKTWHQPGTPPGEPPAPGPPKVRKQQVRLRRFRRNRQAAHHASVVRRHAASLGVQARLASRAVAHRSRHGLRRSGRRRPVPLDRRRRELAGTPRPARPRHRPQVAARRRRHVPAHHHSRSQQSRTASSSPSRPRAPSAPTTAARPGSRSTAGCAPNTSPTRRPRSATAFTTSPCIPRAPACSSCRSTGTSCAATTPAIRGTKSAATCPPTSASRSTFTPTSRRPSTSSPSRATAEHFVPDGKLRVFRSRTGGNEWEAADQRPAAKNCYVNVLRDAMAVDSLDRCGVYFGTTGGQVYASADAGDNWTPIVRDLPAVLSVEVQTLA